jgi:hypothetical protein
VELKPPRFDGSGDVHLFIRQFAEVARLSAWNNQMALVQLRGCLLKSTEDAGRADTLAGVYGRLIAMYGISSSRAREKLYHLRQNPEETYLTLGNRVEKLARLAYGGLGLELENQMTLEHFDRALNDPALRQHLLVARPRTLGEAVASAESYALVSRQPSGLPGARGQQNMVAAVEASPVDPKCEPGLTRVQGLLVELAKKS